MRGVGGIVERAGATAIAQFGEQATRDERMLKGFSAVNIVDSTQTSLSEACRGLFEGSSASAKRHVRYEYLGGTFTMA